MSKVKIQTALSSNFGHTINFGGKDIKFDKLGFAEVDSKEEAEKLAENYGGWLFVGEVPKHKEDVAKSTETADLQKELERLTSKLEDRESTIKALELDSKVWKDELDKYKVLAEQTIEEMAGYKTQTAKMVEELELKVQLTGKNVKDLIATCVALEIPEERYKGKNKEETIQIILDESRAK
jgi:uncharacterized coiled-coil protein SlyX